MGSYAMSSRIVALGQEVSPWSATGGLGGTLDKAQRVLTAFQPRTSTAEDGSSVTVDLTLDADDLAAAVQRGLAAVSDAFDVAENGLQVVSVTVNQADAEPPKRLFDGAV